MPGEGSKSLKKQTALNMRIPFKTYIHCLPEVENPFGYSISTFDDIYSILI